ncbi:sensor domain-containing diguanylate cyclase [Aureimonas fodinaquatilis]|nr:diguanylate cyclase [Aureimonas fodinaquatilis]
MNNTALRAQTTRAAALFIIIFLACLAGIVSRPAGLLAAFWPANALLVGLFTRDRSLGSPLDMLAVVAAYILPDLLTGSSVVAAVSLSAANIVGGVAGIAVFRTLSPRDFKLGRPFSVIKMAAASCVPATVTSFFGAIAANLVFGASFEKEFALWLSSELTSYVTILPFIATMPHRWRNLRRVTTPSQRSFARMGPPAVAFAMCCAFGVLVGGPGATLFPLPALLWFAMAMHLFASTVFLLVYVVLAQLVLSAGYIDLRLDLTDPRTIVSLRFAISLIVLGPLAVAAITARQRSLVRQLRRALATDTLTGALSRGEFVRLSTHSMAEQNCAVLIIDIDHFKEINDTYGHAAGDLALTRFAEVVRSALGREGHFGRLGGEEFALVLPGVAVREAVHFANLLRERVADTPITRSGRTAFNMTVSIGISSAALGSTHLDQALQRADKLLYAAKAGGRNRVMAEIW